MQQLPYRIVECSSHDPDHFHPSSGKKGGLAPSGWTSAKFGDFPITLGLQFLNPVFISAIDIVVDPLLVPTAVDVSVSEPDSWSHSLRFAVLRTLGVVKFDDPMRQLAEQRRQFRHQRDGSTGTSHGVKKQLRHVAINQACGALRLTVKDCYFTPANKFNQIRVLRLRVMGHPWHTPTTRCPVPILNHSEAHDIDRTLDRLQHLSRRNSEESLRPPSKRLGHSRRASGSAVLERWGRGQTRQSLPPADLSYTSHELDKLVASSDDLPAEHASFDDSDCSPCGSPTVDDILHTLGLPVVSSVPDAELPVPAACARVPPVDYSPPTLQLRPDDKLNDQRLTSFVAALEQRKKDCLYQELFQEAAHLRHCLSEMQGLQSQFRAHCGEKYAALARDNFERAAGTKAKLRTIVDTAERLHADLAKTDPKQLLSQPAQTREGESVRGEPEPDPFVTAGPLPPALLAPGSAMASMVDVSTLLALGGSPELLMSQPAFELPHREQGPPDPFFANVADVKSPGPLSTNQLLKAQPYLEVLGMQTLECLYASSWAWRVHAMKRVAERLQSSSRGSANAEKALVSGVLFVISVALQDRVPQVALAGLHLLNITLDRCSDMRSVGRSLSSQFTALCHECLSMCGSSRSKTQEAAMDALLKLSAHPVLPKGVVQKAVLNSLPRNKQWRKMLCTLNILKGLLAQEQDQPSGKLPPNAVLTFTERCLQHPHAYVRTAAIELFQQIRKGHEPEAKKFLSKAAPTVLHMLRASDFQTQPLASTETETNAHQAAEHARSGEGSTASTRTGTRTTRADSPADSTTPPFSEIDNAPKDGPNEPRRHSQGSRCASATSQAYVLSVETEAKGERAVQEGATVAKQLDLSMSLSPKRFRMSKDQAENPTLASEQQTSLMWSL